MNQQDEIDSIKKKVQAVEDVLNYRVGIRKAKEKGLSPPVLNLDSKHLMYEEMSPEQLQEQLRQLQEQLRQLQEKEILLLRGNLCLVLWHH